MKMQKLRRTTAGAIVVNAETLAPVSGCRCRGCGANAKNRDCAERWYVADSAAWCAECALDEYGAAAKGGEK